MKHILFVTDTYYPDSGATTTIIKRTAEALVKRGYNVDVYPAEISGNSYAYPESHKGVKIIQPVREPRGHICFEKTRSAINAIAKLLDNGYDYIFSAAVAFEINLLVFKAFGGKKYKWFPMSYDPYAFDPHITSEQRKEFIKLEETALKSATKIFFLKEFSADYENSPLKEKIIYFNLPCIRPINPNRAKKVMEFDNNFINCVFLGDFYYGVENSDFIFRLFEKLNNPIRLYTVGNLGDYKETVDLWREKLGDKYICHKRITQAQAHNVLLDCDVLVSMGHDSPNMCPSKVIDFIASGKPILHISKIKNCCAEKYLKAYPNKYIINQNDAPDGKTVSGVEQFILNSKCNSTVPFSTVESLYGDFTMEVLVDKIIKELKD